MITLSESKDNALIGIWWWTGDEILGKSCLVDNGFTDNRYIQYSDKENHLTLWRKVCEENNIPKEIINKGYKYYERGRVIYNLMSQSFEVILSQDLYGNKDFKRECKDYFNLYNCRVEFIPLNHYYRVDTDNPAILDFEYG